MNIELSVGADIVPVRSLGRGDRPGWDRLGESILIAGPINLNFFVTVNYKPGCKEIINSIELRKFKRNPAS